MLHGCVAQKEDIGRSVTGEALIAITNWHLLMSDEESYEVGTPLDSPERAVRGLLPITPGNATSNTLEALDNNYLRGKALRYLAKFDDMAVFNDEAHHLGELKKSGEMLEKRWQDALNEISGKKKGRFIQFDFSATPYTTSGIGQANFRLFSAHNS